MGDRVNVLVLGPGHNIRWEEIDDHYEEYRRLIGGTIGTCSLPPGLRQTGFYAFCNDDGVALGLPDNSWATHLGHAVLKGPVVIIRSREVFDPEYDGDAQRFSTAEMLLLEAYFAKGPTAEARQMAANERKFWDENPSGFHIVSLRSVDDLFRD